MELEIDLCHPFLAKIRVLGQVGQLCKSLVEEKQLLQDLFKGVETTCMLHGILQGSKISYAKESKEIKIAMIRFKIFISYVEGVKSPFNLQCRF